MQLIWHKNNFAKLKYPVISRGILMWDRRSLRSEVNELVKVEEGFIANPQQKKEKITWKLNVGKVL